MLIKYHSVTGEVTEVEVTEEWASIIENLDREEYNCNHRETRRHCSLDAYNLDDALIPSGENVESEVVRLMEEERLFAALAILEPRQQSLVRRVYMKGEKIVAIAAEEGVSEAAIRDRLKTIYGRLKKYLKK